MIDVNDLNRIDCKKAREAVGGIIYAQTRRLAILEKDVEIVEEFLEQVEALQRKYTKPVAALLKGPNG